jgi:hypothetical protein
MSRQSKDVIERVDVIAQAWEKRRAEKKFSDMTLSEFREASQESRAARAAIKELTASLKGAKKRSKLADAQLLKVERRVLLCVQGDKEDGEDSALFGEMGFVPRSQRRRARRRTGNGVQAPGPVAAVAPPLTPEKMT